MTIAPFAIDAYLPAFGQMGAELTASPAQLQQTLSAYMLGNALTVPIVGAVSDSYGRRRVLLVGLLLFTLTSIGAALAPSLSWLIAFRFLQGMASSGGNVIGRAVVRDLFAADQAQQVLSLSMTFFALAPAVAPLIGGALLGVGDWRAIFWFLAALGATIAVAVLTILPESLPVGARQRFAPRNLWAGYRQIAPNRKFLLLMLATSAPFHGMFIYIVSAPAFLPKHFGLAPEQFWVLFALLVAGMMGGSAIASRLAGRIAPRRQVELGFGVMAVALALALALALLWRPVLPWHLLPISLFFAGWTFISPVITLRGLDLFPARRGMASSMQALFMALLNALTAGAIAPWVMDSWLALTLTTLTFLVIGWTAWRAVND